MTEPAPLAPDYFCPNPDVECPGHGKDLQEIQEPITDESGQEIGVLITMACRLCGYRW